MRRGLHHLVVNVLDQLPDAFPIVLVIIAAREQNCGLVHLVEGPFVDELVTDALLAEERDEKEGDVKVHVELDARQLVVLDGGGLRRPNAARLLDHVAHGFHQKSPRSAGRIQQDRASVDLYQPVHQRSDVVGREHLSLLRLVLVTRELVEENGHLVLAVPEVGIEVVRNLRNVVNEVVDGLLPWNRDAFSPSFKRSCIAAKITQLCKKRGLMKGLLVLLTYYLLKRKVNNLK